MGFDYWRGGQVRLRAVEPGDWEMHFAWDQDAAMTRAIDFIWPPRSQARARQWAETMALRDPEGDAFQCEIENMSGVAVGHIATHHCDRRVGTFSYGIGVRSEHQRKGYASEAILLICRYYFAELRYQKVTAMAYSFNDASIHLHERLGFQREGQLRRMGYTGGLFYDALYFGLTSEEFAITHGDRFASAPPGISTPPNP
ncbi:MAG TPA: GNAT family protein [Ktedonobacterales bacterium]|jgi:RimJ/RimL family protein N-acetyltransferase|nr:GNAT family protein [Ktedonobacterales bacterium]